MLKSFINVMHSEGIRCKIEKSVKPIDIFKWFPSISGLSGDPDKCKVALAGVYLVNETKNDCSDWECMFNGGSRGQDSFTTKLPGKLQ